MMTPRVHYVVLRHSHHSPHSGYSRVSDYGTACYGGRAIAPKPLPRKLIRNRLMWRLANGVIGYDRASMAAELTTAWSMVRDRGSIYHILFGENTYHYLGILNNYRRNQLIATFHQPPTRFADAVRINWHIRQLSAVICVGRTQQESFIDLLSHDRIFFVPHGVDTDYFTPPSSSEIRDPDLCLFVGEHMRDFPTLRGVIELVAFQRPQTRFVAVIRPISRELLGAHPNLAVCSGVPEAELRELYRAASILVMPLHDATANNAILEGMACGTPMVVTDVGAVRDYVNSECAVLVPPHDSITMAEEVLRLLNEPLERHRMSTQAEQHAQKFSWPEIVAQLQTVYEAVA